MFLDGFPMAAIHRFWLGTSVVDERSLRRRSILRSVRLEEHSEARAGEPRTTAGIYIGLILPIWGIHNHSSAFSIYFSIVSPCLEFRKELMIAASPRSKFQALVLARIMARDVHANPSIHPANLEAMHSANTNPPDDWSLLR